MASSPEDEFVQIEQKKIQESTTRSLQVLNETLRMGVETTEELERQAESLERTETNLDKMNHDLDHSRRLMNVIKSPFHSLFNRSSTKSDDETSVKRTKKVLSNEPKQKSSSPSFQSASSSASTGDAVVDRNLEEMSKALYQIRGIGELMSEQLDDSAAQIDRVDKKMAKAGTKMDKVTKDIKRELH